MRLLIIFKEHVFPMPRVSTGLQLQTQKLVLVASSLRTAARKVCENVIRSNLVVWAIIASVFVNLQKIINNKVRFMLVPKIVN